MRTDVFVKILSEGRGASGSEADLDDAFLMFRDVTRRFSRFRDNSELSLLNGSSERKVSPEMMTILSESIALHKETDGVFDPAVLPVLEAEGYATNFGDDSFGIPSEKGMRNTFGFGALVIDPAAGIVRKPIGLRIDLGGIAKGYAVDRVVHMLRERGHTDFLVDAGGDIFVSGRNSEDGYPFWAIDIADPTKGAEPLALLTLRDEAITTSGTDRRRWMVDGKMRHHLIDPRTGKSAATDLLSATVVETSTIRAEVFAKTLCILGRERALSFAEEHRIPAYLVTVDGETVYNSLIKQYIYDEIGH